MRLETGQILSAGNYSKAQAQRIGSGIVDGISRMMPEDRAARLPSRVPNPGLSKVLGAGAVLAVASIAAAQYKRNSSTETVPVEAEGTGMMPDRGVDQAMSLADKPDMKSGERTGDLGKL